MSSPRGADRLLLAAFVLSGAAALGYELLWTRLLAIALGSETLGVLGVLAGFFGGMAAGAAALHKRAISSPDPARLFAILEAIAAVYALVSPYVLYGLADLLPPLLGPVAGNNDSASALFLSIAIAGGSLLPGTFCMGATLAALVEARRRVVRDDHDGRGVARLYAANTFGATIGVLATVHLLLPSVGMAIGSAILSALGFTGAILGLRWSRRHRPSPTAPSPDDLERQEHDPEPHHIDTSADPDPDVVKERWLLLVLCAATGLLGVGLEVVGVQVLTQVLENTIYTFADILAIYLVGTALGAAIYGRLADRATAGRPASVAAALLVLMSATVIVSAPVLASAPDILEWAAPQGASYAQHMWAEVAVAAAVFLLPTMVMGALFSHIVGLIARGGVGRAYALNTLGSAAAPLVFGVWIIPQTGYRDALFVVMYGYLLTFGVFTWFRRFKPLQQIVPILCVVALSATAPASMILVEANEGWKTLEQRETAMGLVMVSELPQPGNQKPLRRLQVGRKFRMGGAMAFGERRMGHLPLLLSQVRTDAPPPDDALFLGIGTGATLGAVASYDLEHVDAVELVPAVLDQLEYFDDINAQIRNDERVELHAADARRFVAASPHRYDVVVADLFHPARDGAGALYSREHFEAIRDHLDEGGLYAQWLPLYQFDPDTLKIVLRTFAEVFDEVHSFLGVYNVQTPAVVLLGRKVDEDTQPLRFDLAALRERVQQPIYGSVLMSDPRDVFGAYLLDAEGLLAYAGDGPLNTDLNPRVLLRAPRAAYAESDTLGWQSLQPMLAARTGLPDDLLTGVSEAELDAFREDVARFAQALEAYLEGEHLRREVESEDAPVPEASIARYLAAYDLAPEFAPSRGMLYTLAARTPQSAENIYQAMLERTPNEPWIYDAYLRHLQRVGDAEGFEQLRARAVEKFGEPGQTPAPSAPSE